jgi:cytochrome c551/c552
MKVREIVSLVPLAALCLWIGVYPAPILKMIGPDVDAIAAIYAGRISSPLAPSVAADRHDNAVQSPLDNKTALTADAESQPEIQNSLRSLARDGN